MNRFFVIIGLMLMCSWPCKILGQDAKNEIIELTQAAEQGEKDAQFKLGWCFDNGHGVAQDLTKAVYWYSKAAEQGNASAQLNLGCCYAKDKGVAENYIKAIYWFILAAEQGEKMPNTI